MTNSLLEKPENEDYTGHFDDGIGAIRHPDLFNSIDWAIVRANDVKVRPVRKLPLANLIDINVETTLSPPKR